MNHPKLKGLLVRAAIDHSGFAAAASQLKLTPLFPVAMARSPQALTGGEAWYLAEPQDEAATPWDTAHALMRDLDRLAASSLRFVEPDLEQEAPTQEASGPGDGLAATQVKGAADPQNPAFPRGPGFAWHTGESFTQLASARGLGNGGAGARVAHLDTGYDPNHASRPRNLREDLAYDFDRRQWGAADPGPEGPLLYPGHGTGTLSILAGNRFVAPSGEAIDFGGAPEATILPFRISPTVALFRTSAVAAALDRALAPHPSGGPAELPVDLVSMSMGGLPSAAWATAVNEAYLAGICIIAAAGNNFSALGGAWPTRFTVYPARFNRVIAACGIMADGTPYFGRPAGQMQGNFGPASKMGTALAAYSPNISWAERGASHIVDMNGSGTSAATAQVAAAAALWVSRHRAALNGVTEGWRKVEAIRHALFSSTRRQGAGIHEQLGQGVLQASAALGVAPRFDLPQTPADSSRLSFLKLFFGLGIAAPPAQQQMLELEVAQLLQLPRARSASAPLERLETDPDASSPLPPQQARRLAESLIEHPAASRALKESLAAVVARPGQAALPKTRGSTPPAPRTARQAPPTPAPPYLRLRGFALDPSLKQKLETAPVSEVVFKVPWEEELSPGPVGEYLEVIDHDPSSGAWYEPVDLKEPALLAQDGFAPSEGNPKFHQQMVYAVASLTIRHFEAALGRRALWANGPPPKGAHPRDDSNFIRRLRIYPHALREANAYYSPSRLALLFGYFRATATLSGEHLPGGQVFTCLSHDIIAHETAHALLHGMHRRSIVATNPDVRAFHEGFADAVALLQHFTFPEILRHQIALTRGDLRARMNLLGQMATQFGRATGSRGALRDYIGKVDPKTGVWTLRVPQPTDYETAQDAHSRGAVLVAAIFDAFLAIYESRTTDLLRLATNGSGVLGAGAIHPDLVDRLSDEAAKTANHLLRMCIRALDYCPPVDLTFGEYLRAVVTADRDLVLDDDLGYRVAFIDAFRKRGIYPRGLRTLSEDSLVWGGPEQDLLVPSPKLQQLAQMLREQTQGHLHTRSREEMFHQERSVRREVHQWLEDGFAKGGLTPQDAELLGIDPALTFEVHVGRVANRVSPDGDLLSQFVLQILQRRPLQGTRGQAAAGSIGTPTPEQTFEGGATLIVDLVGEGLRYIIRKRITSDSREQRQQAFAAQEGSLWSTYFGGPLSQWAEDEPFALTHRS